MPYSIIVLCEDGGGKRKEIERFRVPSLKAGFEQVEETAKMIKWSKQRRERLGLSEGSDAIVQLFDHREGYELKELYA